MARCPYKFPARSRKAMIDAIDGMANPYSDHYTPYPFSWDVKLRGRWDHEAEALNPFHYEGGTFNPAWDDAWQAEMEGRGDWIIERMRDEMELYSIWPGEDQGQFTFGFAGRQGGHMVLTHAYGIKLEGRILSELLEDDLPSWDPANVRKLYRALVCMTADFTSENVRKALLGAIAFERFQWEEERQQATDAAHAAYAAEMMASRPDMYAAA